MQIFNFVGNLFGYVLWFCYWLTANYGVAIILFTVIVKVLMFPSTIKQQKSMAANARIQGKQAELKKKYGNDKQRFQQELQELYQKEGISPMGGCMPSILPLFIMLGIYYSVLNPLQNTLHVAWEKVSQALSVLQGVPGVGGNFNSFYGEMEIIKHFPTLQGQLNGVFSAAEVEKINFFNRGFNFLGLDLLGTPRDSGFSSMLWLIPVLCLVITVITQLLTQKMNAMPQQGGGCMKVLMYGMPIITAVIAYTVPAAVGFYWVINTVFTFVQTVIINQYYSPAIMGAKAEAQRIALRKKEETDLPMLSFGAKRAVPAGLGQQQNTASAAVSTAKNTGKKRKKNSSSSYLGSKKG